MSWAVFLGLGAFVVVTDRSSLDSLGVLVGAVLVILGFEVVRWPGGRDKP